MNRSIVYTFQLAGRGDAHSHAETNAQISNDFLAAGALM